ncbi:MAG: thioredoxin family protein [Candidatus Eiseniibacteriota bacterium]
MPVLSFRNPWSIVAPRTPRFGTALFAIGVAIVTGRAAEAAPAPATARVSTLDSLVAIESRVRWQPGPPESSLAQAAREARPAFLDFYADWCAPCKWMDRAVYNDPLLGEASEGVAMIRVDVERHEGKALAARYGIRQYPTLVWIAPDGAEKLRWVGPLSLRDTRMNLGQSALPSSRRAEVEETRKQRPDDLAVQTGALLFYGYRGEVERVRTLAGELDKRWAKRPASDRAAVLLSLGKSEEVAGRSERALAAYRQAADLDPEGIWSWRAWLGVSTSQEALKDRASALAAAMRSIDQGPRLPWLSARVARLSMDTPALPTPPGVDDGSAGQ